MIEETDEMVFDKAEEFVFYNPSDNLSIKKEQYNMNAQKFLDRSS